MTKCFTLYIWAVIAFALCSGAAVKADDGDVEQTTESPIADMALVDSSITSTPAAEPSKEPNAKQTPMADSAQPQTIADFIIHPLIALKPRVPEEPAAEGKQATTSTTPAPWQLFGFNPAQGLGSLAGTVSGWLGNRIQIPGLIDTPVGESTSTSTTTTTQRPDVIVRVQHRPTTRRPFIHLDDESRPHRFGGGNNFYDSDEYDEDDYDDDFDNDYRGHNEYDDEPEFDSEEEDDDDEPRDGEEDDDEEEERPVRKQKPNKQRPNKQGNGNKGGSGGSKNKKKKTTNKKRVNNKRRKPAQDSDEVYDDDTEDDVQDDDENEQDFFYGSSHHGSTKRSQSQQGFIQLGQQSLINQIRQLTLGQSPAEIGSTIRKNPTTSSNTKRRHQATLIINRNGQTVYMAPELLDTKQASNAAQQVPIYSTAKRPAQAFPQPPLTVPLKRKGQPTQYITIPWTQLGISPPSQVVSVADGIQSQPLILNIPQSALNAMQQQKPGKRKPVLTSEAVPLLAEASLMDVFKPPQIPPARTPSSTKATKTISSSVTPVLISTKTKQRIRPGTIVEMAPAMDDIQSQNHSEDSSSADSENEHQFLVVGDDSEPGVGRQAHPVVGETRQYRPYFTIYQNRPYNIRTGRQLMEAADKLSAEAMPEVEAMEGKVEKMETEAMPVESKIIEEQIVTAEVKESEAAKETPVVKNSEELIPVQIVNSDAEQVIKSPEVSDIKSEEAKTE